MGTLAFKALGYAESKVGCKYSQTYRWNTNPDIFDCSSLVWRAFQFAGYTFKAGSTSTTEVNDAAFDLIWPSKSAKLGAKLSSVKAIRSLGYEPQPGDVIYLRTSSKRDSTNKITHVIMVKDGATIVHARGVDFGVRLDPIDLYGEKVVAITRYREGDKARNVIDDAAAHIVVGACLRNGVNIRATPGGPVILGNIKQGQPLLVGATSGAWVRVLTLTIAGKSLDGWMHAQYVRRS